MSVIALLASLVIDTAGAPLVIENCVLREDGLVIGRVTADCEISNIGTAALGTFQFKSESRDQNRSVAWNTEDRYSVGISGGLEPGEKLTHWVPFPNIPERANLDTLILRAWDFRTFDADGNEIQAGD